MNGVEKMEEKYIYCADCDKAFKKTDEVVMTDASGTDEIVHVDCIDDFLRRWSRQEYFDTHADMVYELELDLKDE